MPVDDPQTPRRLWSDGAEALLLCGSDTASTCDPGIPKLGDLPALGSDCTPPALNNCPSTPVSLRSLSEVHIHSQIGVTPSSRERGWPQVQQDLSPSMDKLFKAFENTDSLLKCSSTEKFATAFDAEIACFSKDINRTFKFSCSDTPASYTTKDNFTKVVTGSNSAKDEEYDQLPSVAWLSSRTRGATKTANLENNAVETFGVTTPVKLPAIYINQIKENQILGSVLPFDTLERLEHDSSRCISDCFSKGREDKRCGNRPKYIQSEYSRLTSKITQARTSNRIENVISLVPEIIVNAMCKSARHQEIAVSNFCDLLSYVCRQLTEEYRSDDDGLESRFTSVDSDVVCRWIISFTSSSLVSDQTTHSFEQSILALRDPKTPGPDLHTFLNELLASIVPKRRDVSKNGTVRSNGKHVSRTNSAGTNPRTSASSSHLSLSTTIGQQFAPFYPNTRTLTTSQIEANLRELLHQSLGLSEKASGRIYMYWTRGNFGFVKIGFTTQTIDMRLQQWKRQCKHDVQLHQLLRSNTLDEKDLLSSPGQVPFVRRAEKLIHIELSQYRHREHQCEGCGKGHTEWFQVGEHLAKQTVLKWSRWMKRHAPYEGPEMLFKPSIAEEEIEAVCKPIDPSAVSSPEWRNIRGGRKSILTTKRFHAPVLRRSARIATIKDSGTSRSHHKAGQDHKEGAHSVYSLSTSSCEATDETDSEDEMGGGGGGAKLEKEESLKVEIRQRIQTHSIDRPHMIAEADKRTEAAIALSTQAEEVTMIQNKIEMITTTTAMT